jgi:hypothetical protein
MVKAVRGVLVQADESVMAIIKSIDNDRKGFILQELDEGACLVQPDKLAELERLVKAVCPFRLVRRARQY